MTGGLTVFEAETAVLQDRSDLSGGQEARHVNAQLGKRWAGKGLPRLEDARFRVGRAIQVVNLHPVSVGVDDPVLGNPVTSVEVSLAHPVRAGVGDDLDHEGRRPLKVRLGHDPGVGRGHQR